MRILSNRRCIAGREKGFKEMFLIVLEFLIFIRQEGSTRLWGKDLLSFMSPYFSMSSCPVSMLPQEDLGSIH